ncbi:MAG: hypothetical protein CML66_28030 [Rhodobacteraceae bacterium]|nr:hypothetical protein [Paracoccaceae bacterium]MAY47678.1 hypothetical protein [Paracoccaceae bacterium]|tara:strand:+ start:322 stop:573 length:252 start_codon:yes stop_codon:yes gene_type:complete
MIAGALFTGIVAGLVGAVVILLTGGGLGWAFAAYVVVGIAATLTVVGSGAVAAFGAQLLNRSGRSASEARTAANPLPVKRESP